MAHARAWWAITVAALCSVASGQRSTPIQVLHPAPAANDQFARSVAIAGDTMVIGAPQDDVGAVVNQGAAYVFRWMGAGWTLEATLLAVDGAANDLFGGSVALAGDTVVVGAAGCDLGLNADQGAAYVYVRAGTTWTQQQRLFASDGGATDQFGGSVSVWGDTVVVGASLDNIGANADQGSAYVFARTGTAWSQQQKMSAPGGAPNDQFGASVAVWGDTVLIGAHQDDVGINTNQGSAYVFVRTGAAWTQQQQLNASDGSVNDMFGAAVALSANTAVIGAFADDLSATGEGSAYVFVRSGSSWTQQQQLTAGDAAASDQFGYSVGISGDTVVVGANANDVGSSGNQGSAYVFVRSGAAWTEQCLLSMTGGASGDQFGTAVGVSGDTVIVGASADDITSLPDAGSTTVFTRIDQTWIQHDLDLTAPDAAAGDTFGSAAAISGNTAVIGAPQRDVGSNSSQGVAYVFVRTGTSWVFQQQLVASDGEAGAYFGTSVGISGDTIIVGAPVSSAATQGGAAYVFVRAGGVWTQQARLNAPDAPEGDLFGHSVAADGNTVLIGAPGGVTIGSNLIPGSAHVFVRTGSAWAHQQKLEAPDGEIGDQFGISVSLSGNTAVCGAEGDDIGSNSGQGSVWAFQRSGSAWGSAQQILAPGGATSDQFGTSVAISNDTLVAGTLEFSSVFGGVGPGSAYVYVRTGGVWAFQQKLNALDGVVGDRFGVSASLEGDTIIIGASSHSEAGLSQGAAYVFVRTGTVWTQQMELVQPAGASGDSFGRAVTVKGGTVLIGAPNSDAVLTSAGLVRVFDLPFNDFQVAHNGSTGTPAASLAASLLTAQTGQQVSATTRAFAGITTLDTLGRSLGITGYGDVRTPPSSVLTLGGASTLASPSTIELFGDCRTSSSGSAALSGENMLLGSRGILTVRTNSSLIAGTPAATLEGQTRLEQGASLTFDGTVTATGPLTCSFNTALSAGGTLTSYDTLIMTGGTLTTPLLWNRGAASFFSSAALFGSYTNEVGATTTIRSGTLYVFGSLTNGGTIIGSVCAGCDTSLGLEVDGALTLGRSASLVMPVAGARVHAGGAFDAAIDDHLRYDMSTAVLHMEGTGTEQTLEAMSRDIGADAAGLDPALLGHFPLGTLEIGPSPSTVRLVDAHDNDTLGQGTVEAVYVDMLVLPASSRLNNTACRVYYRSRVGTGTVDVAANAIPLPPACYANCDGSTQPPILNVADFTCFLQRYAAGEPYANCDGSVQPPVLNVADFTCFLQKYAAGCP